MKQFGTFPKGQEQAITSFVTIADSSFILQLEQPFVLDAAI